MKHLLTKIYLPALLCIALLAVAAGCTQNDGRIGELFGIWRLESVETSGDNAAADSVLPTLADGEWYDWFFQSSVVDIRLFDPYHRYVSHFGTWRRVDNRLILDYTHRDDQDPSGAGRYSPPTGIYFPEGPAEIDLQIERMTSKDMTLLLRRDDNLTVTYRLRKLY
ncbi:MAG: lipocalin-like domain-containing protein [Clostridium sp.]|nr:lipocalin-like domain-containing protein [Clostridium sp.]